MGPGGLTVVSGLGTTVEPLRSDTVLSLLTGDAYPILTNWG